jgi:hypothetical protein
MESRLETASPAAEGLPGVQTTVCMSRASNMQTVACIPGNLPAHAPGFLPGPLMIVAHTP